MHLLGIPGQSDQKTVSSDIFFFKKKKKGNAFFKKMAANYLVIELHRDMQYRTAAADLLNEEWPRSLSARLAIQEGVYSFATRINHIYIDI